MPPESDPKAGRRLLIWYDQHRRQLPWRPAPGEATLPPAYYTFVSEFMLQQTQVATVVPYFLRFIETLPTVQALAAADEHTVLKLWQGLGYYSRARNLQKAAKVVTDQHGGAFPTTVDELLKLPGVGRYTAGAIASIAFGQRAPILDGNVQRVLCRLDAIDQDPRTPEIQRTLWARALQILPEQRPGDFNSALMELGATVCTPKAPKCMWCPMKEDCEAYRLGIQERIPPAKKAKQSPLVRRCIFLIDHNGKWLVERRPETGRWAGLWQFITVDPAIRPKPPIAMKGLKSLGELRHALTHRQYIFEVVQGTAKGSGVPKTHPAAKWVDEFELDGLAMSKPQRRAWEMRTTQ